MKYFSALYAGNLQASLAGDLLIFIPKSYKKCTVLEIEIVFFIDTISGALKYSPECIYTDYALCSAEIIGSLCGPQTVFPCVNTYQTKFGCIVQFVVADDLTAISLGKKTIEKKIYYNCAEFNFSRFEHMQPVNAFNIGFAVGNFMRFTLSKKIHFLRHDIEYYLLSSRKMKQESLKKSLSKAKSVFENYARFLDKTYPFSCYRQVFVNCNFASFETALPFSGMAILNDSLLINVKNGKEDKLGCSDKSLSLSVMVCQALCIAYSYFGALLSVAGSKDVWMVPGICWYLTFQYVRASVENDLLEDPNANFYLGTGLRQKYSHFELLSYAKKRLCEVSKLTQNIDKGIPGFFHINRTLEQPKHDEYPVQALMWQTIGLDFHCTVSLRAFFLFHILEKQISSNSLKLLLRAWLTLEKFSGISLKDLFARIKSISAEYDKLYDNFCLHWLKVKRFPTLLVHIKYDKRKNSVEILCQNPDAVKTDLKFKIVEDDGVWEHKVKLFKALQYYSFLCKSQPHRKKGGRKPARELEKLQLWKHPEQLDSAQLLDIAGGKDISMPGLLRQRRLNKLNVDERWWRKETPVKYVLFDPDFCWEGHCSIIVDDETMILEMLNDEEMTSQPELLSSVLINYRLSSNLKVLDKAVLQSHNDLLEKFKSDLVNKTAVSLRWAAVLASVIVDGLSAVSVRKSAILALARWQTEFAPLDSNSTARWNGLDLLKICFVKLFTSKGKLLPNDFDVVGEFDLKLAFIDSFGIIVRAKNGLPHKSQLDFMLHLLEHNDNLGNRFIDSLYLSRLIFACSKTVADIVACTRLVDKKKAESQDYLLSYVERSANDIISDNQLRLLLNHVHLNIYSLTSNSDLQIMCLKSLRCLMLNRVIEVDYLIFKKYAATSESYSVRLVCFKIYFQLLLQLKNNNDVWKTTQIIWLLKKLLKDDSTVVICKVLDYLISEYKSLGYIAGSKHILIDKRISNECEEIAWFLWKQLNKIQVLNQRIFSRVYQLWMVLYDMEEPSVFKTSSREFQNSELGPYAHWVSKKKKKLSSNAREDDDFRVHDKQVSIVKLRIKRKT